MKTTKKQQIAKRNYRQFYAVLKKLAAANGMDADDLKYDLVKQFTDGRTEHLTEMHNIEYYQMLGAMGSQATTSNNDDKADKERKRVMAAIGGWLRIMNMNESLALIKGIACKAAACKEFNKIPPNKLRAIYSEFLNKQKIAENSKSLTGIIPISPN